MSQHARIGFSSLARTVQCPGSVVMCEKYPNPPNDAADEGTLAHAVACDAAQDRAHPECLDLDMQRGAEMWRGHVQAAGGGLLEMPCQATDIHPAEVWGTPDFRGYDRAEGVLRVGDYKYGFEEVSPVGNWQLIGAASAMMTELDLTGADYARTTIELSIVQPRGYHLGGPVRTWTITPRELTERVITARYAVAEALGSAPRLRRGPECKYCPARHVCYELQNHGYAAADYGRSAEPNELLPGALGHELALIDDYIETLEARRTGLFAQAEAAVRSGETVHGYGMMPGRASRAWNDPAAALALYPQLAKSAEPITPTQAQAAKLLAPDMVAALATRPPAAMSLKRIKAGKLFAR